MSASLNAFAAEKLDALELVSLTRRLLPTRRLDGVWVERGGRRLISFSCNDYFGLTHHPAVKAAGASALMTYGAGAGASRLVTGEHPLFGSLEARLADLKGHEDACVFGSGYLANVGVIPTFVGTGDRILLDELSHACIWAGAKLSGAEVLPFRHNDLTDLAAKLATECAGRTLVATESVFSMDGDRAPLGAIGGLCGDHGAWLLVDDAHGFGMAQGGDGAILHSEAGVDLAMGTLSKAVGSYGAYVCASAAAIDLIKSRCRTLIYTTGLPPAAVGAALGALDVMQQEPWRGVACIDRAQQFVGRLGLPDAQSGIVAVIVGDTKRALAASADLETKGLLAVAIRPPTVPEGTSRLRCAFSALHTEEHVERLVAAVRPWIAQ